MQGVSLLRIFLYTLVFSVSYFSIDNIIYLFYFFRNLKNVKKLLKKQNILNCVFYSNCVIIKELVFGIIKLFIMNY